MFKNAGSAYTGFKKNKLKVVENGTYLAMEGPQFSTLAESKMYKNWG